MSAKPAAVSLVALIVLGGVLYLLFRVLLWTVAFFAVAVVLVALFTWIVWRQLRRGPG
jgi:hypothetical protein